MNHEIAIEPGIFFGQMAYVLGGLLLLLMGAAIFYTMWQWRRHGQQVEAVVLGIRRRGAQVHSVYRYAMPDGGLREVTSVQGSSSMKGRETGRRMMIRVMPGHAPGQPDEAREAPGFVMWALASGLVLGGAWLTYDSVISWRRSPVTWIVVAVVAMYLGRKIWRRLARFLTSMQSKLGAADGWSDVPIETVETLPFSPQPIHAQITGAKPARSSAIFCILGLVIFAVAYIPAHKLILLRAGARTQGTVWRLSSQQFQHNRHNVFPEVQFTDENGATIRFLDHTGSNPSPYKVGDHVAVLYQPGRQGSAMIDRGFRNWLPVAALLLLGTVFTSLGLLMLSSLYGSAKPSDAPRPYRA
jgi:uncharacterized protein DUF3592